MRAIGVLMLVACGGGGPAPAPSRPAPPPPTGPSEADLAQQHAHDEQARRDDLVAAHRKLEIEQQEALAATCDDADKKANHQRCQPSCYAAVAADPRAGKKVTGAVEIQHAVCQRAPDGPFFIADEIDAKLAVRAGKPVKPHKKGTWQADVEAALAPDAIVVTGAWRDVTHPLTKEKLRCASASHFATIRKPLDVCGGSGDVVCEASGNAACHGVDVLHYRLAEARALQAAGDAAGCQQAALEAVAVARGLPRWRQYAKVNVDRWPKGVRFRTRLDGTLDEDALFAAAAALGTDAEAQLAACGGTDAKTTAAQEQSFHVCW